MLKIIFQEDMTEQEAEKLTGLKYIEFPDDVFNLVTKESELVVDKNFIHFKDVIDQSDMIAPGVFRHRPTKTTHGTYDTSTGVFCLWMLLHLNNKYLFPSQWFGENCYQEMLNIGKRVDVYIYEDSNMFYNMIDEKPIFALCSGEFLDVRANHIVTIDPTTVNVINWALGQRWDYIDDI